jgi:hypothetical protein
MLKTLQNFYKAVVTTGLDTGTGTCYVSVLPTPSAGYLVINPSNATKREIVAYSGTGTDEGGNYVTLTTRGVGGTTEQAHDVNEPVRLNVTAEYYSDIQTELNALSDEIDTLVLQNAPNASTTTRGIVLMSTAPAEAGTAIVVGTNDPRLTPPTGEPSAFVAVSSGAVNAGSGVVLNASGFVDETMIPIDYVKTVPWTTGLASQDISSTTTLTIAHGLGTTPTRVKLNIGLSFWVDSSNDYGGISDTVVTYNGTNTFFIAKFVRASTNTTDSYAKHTSGSGTTFVIYDPASEFYSATYTTGTISVDATNITITWSKSGSPSGTAQIVWEAEAVTT